MFSIRALAHFSFNTPPARSQHKYPVLTIAYNDTVITFTMGCQSICLLAWQYSIHLFGFLGAIFVDGRKINWWPYCV